jgi:2-polyprenyl-3-methyl-5-hydroxy-6-metoxy-1,4-benzoquinol methylase
MPFGSDLAKFEEIYLKSADEKEFKLKNNFFTRLGFRVIGLPHIESRIRAKRIFSLLPKKGGKKRILDAGCGPGLHSSILKKKGFDVYSIDIDKEKVKFLKKSPFKLKVYQGDITNTNFKKGFFDYIVCSDVIEHIKNDKKAIKELSRILKKGGNLILTVPSCSQQNKDNWKRYGHERVGYSIKDLKELGKKNNLKIIDIKPYSGKIVEKAFEINEKLYNNNILLGILFYPLYLSSFIEDIFKNYKKSFNGVCIRFIKN